MTELKLRRRRPGAGGPAPDDRLPRGRRPAAESDRRGRMDARVDPPGRRQGAAHGRGLRGSPRLRAGGGPRPQAFSGRSRRTSLACRARPPLDEDLTPFYEVAANDPDLAWVTAGAGRLLRSPTVFEDVVKTICTTNCTWSATVRMVSALVESLGEPGADADGPFGRAFPTPEAMARKNSPFYTETVRAGYRGAYLKALSKSVASGRLDLESFARASTDELPDEELAALLLALPGVGPYAAAHVMMLLGRYTPLVLDSWTRPTYLQGLRSEEREGHDHRASLPPLRRVRRARLLALPDPGLGCRVGTARARSALPSSHRRHSASAPRSESSQELPVSTRRRQSSCPRRPSPERRSSPR